MYFLGAGFFSLSSKGQARTKIPDEPYNLLWEVFPEPGWRGEDSLDSHRFSFSACGCFQKKGYPKMDGL